MVQFSSVAQSCLTLCDPHESQHARPPCPSPAPRVHSNSRPSSQWCHPAISSAVIPFSSCPQSLPASESFLMSQPKYWSFSFSIIPSKEHPGLISFRMDWFDPLAVQGTLKGLLQHHSSKASIFRCWAFFTVQLSHPYMTTGKTIALTRRTFVGKGMSLLLNMLSRLVITFLPRSKRLLMSWLQSPSAVILGPQKIKSDTVSTVSPSISWKIPWTEEPDRLQSMGLQRVGHDWATSLSLSCCCRASLVAQPVKKSACNAGYPGLIPGLGRSSGEGHGNPL